jgi:hypothetical protein
LLNTIWKVSGLLLPRTSFFGFQDLGMAWQDNILKRILASISGIQSVTYFIMNCGVDLLLLLPSISAVKNVSIASRQTVSTCEASQP